MGNRLGNGYLNIVGDPAEFRENVINGIITKIKKKYAIDLVDGTKVAGCFAETLDILILAVLVFMYVFEIQCTSQEFCASLILCAFIACCLPFAIYASCSFLKAKLLEELYEIADDSYLMSSSSALSCRLQLLKSKYHSFNFAFGHCCKYLEILNFFEDRTGDESLKVKVKDLPVIEISYFSHQYGYRSIEMKCDEYTGVSRESIGGKDYYIVLNFERDKLNVTYAKAVN